MKLSKLFRAARLRPALDASSVSRTIERALSGAGLRPQNGPRESVATAVQRMLAGVGIEIAAPAQDRTPRRAPQAEPAGSFERGTYTNAAGTRAYKLYVPASPVGEAMPMVVMLHGCTQSADDFAAGTRMNELAETHGFLVLYPEQAVNANGSKCWNWFRPADQVRDGGEPALIAGLTREIAQAHGVDPRRIYVAGLSAGAAMAVILGATYPELYAAVGAHSGLPLGAAHDMPSAFAAMKRAGPMGSARNGPAAAPSVPTIVFHGDQDQTVDARNGAEIVAQAAAERYGAAPLQTSQQQGTSAGSSYSRTVHAAPSGQPVVEHWVLHGAGHAWSGGSTAGTYTDATGPDASAEMVRFFLSQAPAGRNRM